MTSFDVRRYDLDFELDPEKRRLAGCVTARIRASTEINCVELDLDSRLTVSRVSRVKSVDSSSRSSLDFEHINDVLKITLPDAAVVGTELSVAIEYEGAPRESTNPPFDGGFTWGLTAAGQPWVGVSVQLAGASLWWPCKDSIADKPDLGVSLHITAPTELMVVANGRRTRVETLAGALRRWHWDVTYPINLYNVTFYAAPYVELAADYVGVDGSPIPFSFFVLPEDVEDGQRVLPELVSHLRFLEQTYGPYPFRGDKYAIVLSPYIGMEHQSAIAYGRAFDARIMGFLWIALHEASHEWWGNLVTAAGWQDFWLHEGFAKYTEALFAGHVHGMAAYHEYLARFVRPRIENDRPLAPRESLSLREIAFSAPNSTKVRRDPYDKGAMLLHSLRYLIGEQAFSELLRCHAYPDPTAQDGRRVRLETSDGFMLRAEQISGCSLAWFFEVYLRHRQLPRLHVTRSESDLRMRWEVPGGLPFPMPVEIVAAGERRRVEMPDSGTVTVTGDGKSVVVDPDWWILRDEVPDPDQFGTLGCQAVSLDAAMSASRPGLVGEPPAS